MANNIGRKFWKRFYFSDEGLRESINIIEKQGYFTNQPCFLFFLKILKEETSYSNNDWASIKLITCVSIIGEII